MSDTLRKQAARPKVSVWVGDEVGSRIDVDNALLAFRVTKTVDAPAGSFSLTITPRAEVVTDTAPIRVLGRSELVRLLRPNAVVSIGMDRPGGIMLGLVDRVSQSMTTGGDVVTHTLTITGRDFGKLLVNDSVMLALLNVPQLADFTEAVGAVLGRDHPLAFYVKGVWAPVINPLDELDRRAYSFIGAGPEQVATWVLDNAPSMRIPILARVFGGDGTAGSIFKVKASTWNDGRLWDSGLSDFKGTLWSFMERTIDPDYYEVRVESVPSGYQDSPIDLWGLLQLDSSERLSQPYLVIRPKPFTEAILARDHKVKSNDEVDLTWESLKPLLTDADHEITGADVFSFELGIDDADAYSFFQVTSRNSLFGNDQQAAEGLAYPTVDLWNARNHGLRAMNCAVNLIGSDARERARGDLDYTGQVYDDVHRFRNLLVDWYWMNPRFVKGTITCKGRDNFRAGDPCSLPWFIPPVAYQTLQRAGIRAYITSVTWSWSVGQEYTCSLEIERGHNDQMVESAKAEVFVQGGSVLPIQTSMLAET